MLIRELKRKLHHHQRRSGCELTFVLSNSASLKAINISNSFVCVAFHSRYPGGQLLFLFILFTSFSSPPNPCDYYYFFTNSGSCFIKFLPHKHCIFHFSLPTSFSPSSLQFVSKILSVLFTTSYKTVISITHNKNAPSINFLYNIPIYTYIHIYMYTCY